MKVKNEYIQIKIGDKTWTKKNMILNEYLYRLFNSQINISHDDCYVSSCYLKLDTPIENVGYDSEILPSEFDITIKNLPSEKYFKAKTTRTNNSIRINYVFDSNSLFIIDNLWYEASIMNNYANRRIMGIGFGINDSSNIFAYLDTSNMNIVINYNESISISRVDLLQSDGVCDGIEYPLHLVNDLAFKDKVWNSTTRVDEYTKAQLYSVGFGNKLGLMEEEHTINDVEISRDDTSITFNVQRNKKVGHYPSENLQLGFYPTIDNSKYLIFKYRLYRHSSDGTNVYLDKYYTMSVPNESFGNLNIKLKMERL